MNVVYILTAAMFVSQEVLQKESKGPPKWRSTRFLLSYMGCAGLMVLFFQRVSMSLAIVCMVNHTAVYVHQSSWQGANISNKEAEGGNTTSPVRWSNDLSTRPSNTSLDPSTDQDDQRCPAAGKDTDAVPNSDEDGPFTWDKQTQGLILAALYIGYLIGHLPLSFAFHHFGIRKSLFGGYMVMSLSHVLCHPAALLSPWAVFVMRIIVGFFNGWVILSMFSIWTKWAPRTEQSQLLGITFCGEMIGSFAVFPLTASLCRHGFWDGWPSVFYVFGGVGVVWSVAWLFLMRDSPELHPRISPEEQKYIVTTRADTATEQTEKVSVPWRSALRSSCYWAMVVATFTFAWGMFLMLSNLPTFLYEVMHFDIHSNGLYSMLPYITMFITVSGSGFIFDTILQRRLLSKLMLRKLVSIVAYIGPGILLVVMSHMECHQATLVVVLLAVAVGLSGLPLTGGFFVNTYDLAPQYASSLYTLSNVIAITGGIVSPYVVAVITADSTREQWQMVFYVTGAIYLAGTVIFCVLGKADVQPWAVPETEEPIPEDNHAERSYIRRFSSF